MAKRLFLTADTDSVTLSDAGFTVFGGTGNQTVKLTSAATGATLDANIERVELSGNLSAYTFKAVSGTGLQIYSGSTLVGTIGSLNQNATVAFADGSAALLQTGATTFTLGGQTVTTSATAAAITGATVNASDKSTVAVTIPTFSVTAGAATATEDGNATFTVSLNQAQTAATTVTLALTGTGGATIGTDTGTMTASGATLAGNVLTFAAGSTSAVITVPVTWDATTETGEGLSLALSAPTGVTGIAASSTPATVALADSPVPTFTLTSNTVAGTPTQEGGSILFTITPSGVVDKTTVLTVNLAGEVVGAITSKASAEDFSAAQTVTFLAGDKAARTTSINVTTDSSTEGIEGYKASLLDSTFTEKSSVTGTITDATATYVLTGPTSVNEGASATYTVTSSLAAPTGGITIPYTLTGNATLTTDYTGSSAATGNITIAAGSKTGTLILSAVADNETEATAENVIVTLGTPSSGNVTTGTVTTTIADTSQGLAAGTVALSSSATAVDEGGQVTYTVTLGTAAPTGGLSIPYTLSGTSTLTSDYTGSSATTGNISVAAGAKTGTLTVTTVADTTTEGSETLIVTLGTLPSGYTLVSGQGVATTTINDTSLTVAGQTFTLTTSTDSIPGLTGSGGTTSTAGDDTVTGTITTGTASTTTLNVSDAINTGAGVDTVSINYASTAATLASSAVPVFTGVEVLSVTNLSGASTLNGAIIPSATTFNYSSPVATAALTATVLPSSLNTLGVSTIATDDNDFSLTWATGTLSGASDAFNINLSGVSAATTATAAKYPVIALIGPTGGSGFETVNVAASTASRLDDLTSTDGTTQTMTNLNVSGAGSFTVNTALNFKGTSGTINASGNSGGVKLLVGTENITMTGGSGNDVLMFGTAGDLDASDSLNLGGGTSDTIILADTAVSSTTTALNAAINNSTAEVIGFFVGANTSVDMAYVTPSMVLAQGTDNFTLTVTKAATTDSVIIGTGTATTADVTVSGQLGYTTSNLVLNGTSTASVSMDVLTAQSLATVNISSLGSLAGTPNTIATLTLSDQATVTITGAQPLTITNALANTTVAINGAAMTGALSLTTGTSASSVVGGSGKDTITGGTGADTIDGGAGDDTINTGVDGAVGTTITGGLGADAITSGHVAASAATIAFNATAAESFSGGAPTTTTSLDTLTLGDLANGGTTTVTFTTGITPTSQTGAITVTTTAPTMGTTAVSAGGFVVYQSIVGAGDATIDTFYAYQDTDGDGVIEQGEFAVKIVGTTDNSDTEAFSVTSGKLVLLLTGV